MRVRGKLGRSMLRPYARREDPSAMARHSRSLVLPECYFFLKGFS
jgi:hypothetical protein